MVKQGRITPGIKTRQKIHEDTVKLNYSSNVLCLDFPNLLHFATNLIPIAFGFHDFHTKNYPNEYMYVFELNFFDVKHIKKRKKK